MDDKDLIPETELINQSLDQDEELIYHLEQFEPRSARGIGSIKRI